MNKTNTKLLQITALGGLHEYGKNMYLFEAINPDSRKALIVDAGIIFPGLEYPGVDYKLADYKYALSNKIAIEALVLTNMHEAHSGGAHHVINKCNIKKVIGSKLALQLVKAKLGEAQVKSIEWINFESRQELIVDDFKITPFTFATCTHESYAVLIEAYGSKVFYTSSFKIDQTSLFDKTDIAGICVYGCANENTANQIDLMISDSSNVEREGYSKSELEIINNFRNIFNSNPSRVIVNTYSSNTIRLQNLFNLAESCDRKVALLNREAREVFEALKQTGILKYNPANVISIKEIDNYPDSQILVISTAPEGEAIRELVKIAYDRSLEIQLKEGDVVINSADLPPGTVRQMAQISDQFFLKKVKIVGGRESGVHVENHAMTEEMKFMFNIVRPKYFLPAFGETRHLVRHARLALETNFDPGSMYILENGDQIQIANKELIVKSHINTDEILFNDQQDFHVDTKIVKERESLAKEGVVTVTFSMNKKNKVVSGPVFSAKACTFSNNKEWRAFCLMNSTDIINAIEKHGEDNPNSNIDAYQDLVRDHLNHIIKTQIGKKPAVIVMANQV